MSTFIETLQMRHALKKEEETKKALLIYCALHFDPTTVIGKERVVTEYSAKTGKPLVSEDVVIYAKCEPTILRVWSDYEYFLPKHLICFSTSVTAELVEKIDKKQSFVIEYRPGVYIVFIPFSKQVTEHGSHNDGDTTVQYKGFHVAHAHFIY